MKCVNCGFELKDTAKFCIKCGTKVEKQEHDTADNVLKHSNIKIDVNADKEILYKRTFMYIEDGRKEEAYAYLEWFLDNDPEDAKAYLGKLLLDLNIEFEEDLVKCSTDISSNKNYRRAYKYGDEEMRKRLEAYSANINNNISQSNLGETSLSKQKELKDNENEVKYMQAKSLINQSNDSDKRTQLIKLLKELGDYRDSRALAEELDKTNKYKMAIEYKNQAAKGINTKVNLEKAIIALEELGDYSDSLKYLNVCKKMMGNLS